MERNLSIDILRGISIAIVVISHMAGTGAGNIFVVDSTYIKLIINSYYGVAIFFVISGFLITTTSLNRFVKDDFRKFEILEFYKFRISRIFPPLICLVVLNLSLHYASVGAFVIPPTMSIAKLLTYVFTFRFNYLYLNGGALLPAWAILWSLAVEEIFYLFFPLAAFILRRPRYAVIALCALIMYAPFYRHLYGWGSCYLNFGASDLLAYGCLAALLAKFYIPHCSKTVSRCIGYLGLLLFAVPYLATQEHTDFVWAPCLIGIGIAAFLFAVANGRSIYFSAFNNMNLLAPMGRASYELYLFHMAFILLIALSPRIVAMIASIPRDIYDIGFFAIASFAMLQLDKRVFLPIRKKIRAITLPTLALTFFSNLRRAA